MDGKKLAMFLLLVVFLELMLLPAMDANPLFWRRRRRRRRYVYRPVCSSSNPGGQWSTTWHQRFDFRCQNGSSIRLWRSKHRNCKEDRVHNFECTYGPVRYKERHCATTFYWNDYRHSLNFKCHHNGFITGVKSEYSSSHKDRRFGFRCCIVPGYFQRTCKHTGYLNKWDREVNYSVPKSYYLVGVNSYYDNRYRDRRWSFEICKFIKRSGKC